MKLGRNEFVRCSKTANDEQQNIQRLTKSEQGRFLHKIFVLITHVTTVYGRGNYVTIVMIIIQSVHGLPLHNSHDGREFVQHHRFGNRRAVVTTFCS
jgi:hypothetical protein